MLSPKVSAKFLNFYDTFVRASTRYHTISGRKSLAGLARGAAASEAPLSELISIGEMRKFISCKSRCFLFS